MLVLLGVALAPFLIVGVLSLSMPSSDELAPGVKVYLDYINERN